MTIEVPCLGHARTGRQSQDSKLLYFHELVRRSWDLVGTFGGQNALFGDDFDFQTIGKLDFVTGTDLTSTSIVWLVIYHRGELSKVLLGQRSGCNRICQLQQLPQSDVFGMDLGQNPISDFSPFKQQYLYSFLIVCSVFL